MNVPLSRIGPLSRSWGRVSDSGSQKETVVEEEYSNSCLGETVGREKREPFTGLRGFSPS